jgi:hypothetical protein
MPRTRSTASATGLTPVPVAVLLPSPAGRRSTDPAGGDLPDWHGVAPRDAAGLVARLSKPGDLVIEVDGHPTIIRAASHLGRRSAVSLTEGDGVARSTPDPARPRFARRAGLILAGLPRPGGEPEDDLAAISATMRTWRARLRPGGYLLTALTPAGSSLGRAARPVSHRTTVIAAARAAGFTWQQEFLVPTAPLPDDEPRAMPATATVTPTVLVDGRHRPAHVKVLAFRNNAGGSDA